MIDNTALLKARVKMIVTKKQTRAMPISRPKSVSRTSQSFNQYSAQARLILRDISELRDLVLDKRKEYILCSGSLVTYTFTNVMSEADRLRFENDSATALKQCTKLVQFFQIQINSDRTLRRDDEHRHLRLVAQMLDAYLRQIATLIEQLRFIYRRQSERMRKICRLANLVEKYEHSIDDAFHAIDAVEQRSRHQRDGDTANIAPTHRLSSGVGKKVVMGRSDIDNRRALQLDVEPKAGRVRVYDFTSDMPRTRLREARKDGTAATVDGWSELDDPDLLDDVDIDRLAKSSASQTSVVEADSGRGTDRFAVGSAFLDDEGGDQGWSDANLDFSVNGALSETSTVATKSATHRGEGSFGNSKKRQKDNTGQKPKDKLTDSALFADPSEPLAADPLDVVFPELSHVEQEQLVLENRKLFDKLAYHDEDILHIGQQLTEIERLQSTFAQKISEQEHDIDNIHTQTIYTLDNLETANQFIRDAIKNSASRRVVALFCLLVLTFTLLFLDWYNL